MSTEMLSNVADLLGKALNSHDAIKNVVLSTREGVVVAAVSKHEETDPRLLSTISAALTWVGGSALKHLGQTYPTQLVLSTNKERVIVIVQAHYSLIVVVATINVPYFDMQEQMKILRSIAARIEVMMSSSPEFSTAALLGNIIRHVPGVSQAMLLTTDGLPLGAIGIDNEIEMAALVGAMFANGLTFSEGTEHIIMTSEDTSFLVLRVDEKRLILVTSNIFQGPDDWERVIDIIHQSV